MSTIGPDEQDSSPSLWSTDLWAAAQELSQSSTPFVAITLVQTRGHAPQEPGAKCLVTSEGLAWGTVGGGKLETKSIEHARAMLARLPEAIKPELYTWNLQRDVGMTCGGEATMLFEVHTHDSWRIVVFGAGHVAQALVRTLMRLECRITCVDPRPEWLNRLPESRKIRKLQRDDMPAYLQECDEKTFFVLMTRGHASDLPIAIELLRRFPNAAYAGMLGSKIKALRVRRELKEAGIPEEVVARFHIPIGLPLGGNDPVEIALSVAAQLVQERDRLRNT